MGTSYSVELQTLHYAYMPLINKAIDGFKEYCNNYPLSTVGHKSPLTLFISRYLSDQVINIIMDPETLIIFLNNKIFH